MNSSRLNFVALRQASLCMDCDLITEAHTRCFACGSAALLNVAKALSGDESADYGPVIGSAVIKKHGRHPQPGPLLCETEGRTSHSSYGELVVFPQIAGMRDRNSRSLRGLRRSFRDVAAMVQKAITVSIIAAGLLGMGAKPQAASLNSSAGSIGSHVRSIIRLADGVDGMPNASMVTLQQSHGVKNSALLILSFQDDTFAKALRHRWR